MCSQGELSLYNYLADNSMTLMTAFTLTCVIRIRIVIPLKGTDCETATALSLGS